AGFPQDHALFAGHLPADRPRLRTALAPYDLVLVVGAPFLRQYPYGQGRLTEPGTRVAVITDDPAEAHRAPADLAVVTELAGFCDRLARRIPPRPSGAQVSGGRQAPAPASTTAPEPGSAPASVTNAASVTNSGSPQGIASPQSPAAEPDLLAPPAPGQPLRAAHVLAALASRLPAETVIVEETPSSRPDLHQLLPARRPLGFLSAAMGGLGFAMPAAIGVRMAQPERPVVAVVGDGSSLYQVQSLWTAAHYGVGVVFVVLANGRYAVMDRLAEKQGGKPPWPAFEEVSVSGLAESLGCPARRIARHADLLAALDELVPTLGSRSEPVVLEVAVVPDPEFHP
ncbi:MAG: benzoylformate decarboxylase, partial [Streptomyces sp.]|nr:benzoylformate decarboxylase [Streptomyces sp.]